MAGGCTSMLGTRSKVWGFGTLWQEICEIIEDSCLLYCCYLVGPMSIMLRLEPGLPRESAC